MQSLLTKIRLLPIYAVFIYTWTLTGFGKFMGEGVPGSFVERFQNSFLASFPGLTLAYYQIATLEVLAALFFIVSLVKLEFLPGRNKIFLEWGLWFSVVTFAVLGFGLRLVGDNAGAASLFFYFGASLVATLFVDRFSKT